MKYIHSNTKFQHFINLCTYWFTLLFSRIDKKQQLKPNVQVSPLWITGFFRSGTSITANLMFELGFDFGPTSHLLKSRGVRGDWNPNGFYENYLFMDWSLSIFEDLNSWGHKPPSEIEVERYDISKMSYHKFLKQTLIDIHDDRISNINKVSLLRKYYPNNINEYLKNEFQEPFAIKNPHFSVLSETLLKFWPESKFLVVFRNPDASLSSSKKIADIVDYNLYIDYYKRLLNKESIEVVYFSYDNLMLKPMESIVSIVNHFNLKEELIQNAIGKINPKLYRHKQKMKQEDWPKELLDIYIEMNKRAIN